MIKFLYGTAERYAVEAQREAASTAAAARSTWQNKGDVAHARTKALQLQVVSAELYRSARHLMGLEA